MINAMPDGPADKAAPRANRRAEGHESADVSGSRRRRPSIRPALGHSRRGNHPLGITILLMVAPRSSSISRKASPVMLTASDLLL